MESEEEPFSRYNISNNWKKLADLKGRTSCPKCHKSRKYFCYTCCIPLREVENFIPQVKLPIKIDILKHRSEIDGKSTAVHAAILAPNYVKIYHFPDNIPSYPNDGKTVFVYPNPNSCSLKEYFEANPIKIRSKDECSDINDLGKIIIGDKVLELPFNRLVFVDGTWPQSRSMNNTFKELPCIVLQSRLSQFWRHQKKSPRWYLATIEAVHQSLNEIHQCCAELVGISPLEYKNTEYDNLLFFFRFMHFFIHSLYDHNELLSYRRPVNL